MRFYWILVLVVWPNILFGQFSVGDVPAGTGIGTPEIFMYVDTNVSMPEDSSYLDLDCDGIADLGIVMRNGNMSGGDVLNWIKLAELNSDYTIYVDTISGEKLFNFGYTIDGSISEWITPDDAWIGMFAAWDLFDAVVYNKYFIYRKSSTNQFGWVKISYDLDDWDETSAIHLYISEALYLCAEASLDEHHKSEVSLYPNPTNEGVVSIQSNIPIVSYRLYSSIGKLIGIESSSNVVILPESNGVYFVYWEDAAGRSGVERVVKK